MELCLCGAWKWGEFGWRMDICTSMAEFLCCSLETITTLLTGYTPIQNKELKKNKNKTTLWPSNPTTGHIPRENHNSKRITCTLMFTETLFTMARTWKQPKCPSTDEWIKNIWYMYTMEYYLATKKEWNWIICRDMDV